MFNYLYVLNVHTYITSFQKHHSQITSVLHFVQRSRKYFDLCRIVGLYGAIFYLLVNLWPLVDFKSFLCFLYNAATPKQWHLAYGHTDSRTVFCLGPTGMIWGWNVFIWQMPPIICRIDHEINCQSLVDFLSPFVQ